MNFPDEGDEEQGADPKRLVDDFEAVLLQAVEERLRADVPVGAYLSGGVDSSMIVALACHLKGPAINTYTVRVHEPELDELDAASLSARHIGTKPPIVQDFRHEDALKTLSAIDRRRRGAGDRHLLRGVAPARRTRACLRPESRADRRRERTNGWSDIRGTRRRSS
jgi:asparagine synthetase B (glutamine-hydrolysing)